MTFNDWLVHTGLSAATAYKYASTVAGPLSSWAMDTGLTQGPLTAITSSSRFEPIASEIRELTLFKERNRIGNGMYEAALKKFSAFLSEGYDSDLETDLNAILQSEGVHSTETTSLVTARVGQGAFRQKLIHYWGRCSVTGITDPNFLIASHIKPWAVSTHTERLDTYNGLLLVPNLDRAFDGGFITFNEHGQIQLSPQLTQPEILGISEDLRAELQPQHQHYMAFHRAQVFRSS